MSKYNQNNKQSKITTSGISKTTPGLDRKPTNVKNPININGRLFRDPRAKDLVEWEQALNEKEAEAAYLKKQAEKEIQAKKDIAKQKEMDAYAAKKLAESKAEGTN